MKTKFFLTTALVFAGVLTFTVINGFQAKKPWVVPDKYVKMKNPVVANAESMKTGKDLWMRNCQSCHGKSGHGDGTKAAQLKTEPGNLSLPEDQKQSDGSLFYKISEGREDMPGFKKKIPDAEDIWGVVNYIRSFKS